MTCLHVVLGRYQRCSLTFFAFVQAYVAEVIHYKNKKNENGEERGREKKEKDKDKDKQKTGRNREKLWLGSAFFSG